MCTPELHAQSPVFLVYNNCLKWNIIELLVCVRSSSRWTDNICYHMYHYIFEAGIVIFILWEKNKGNWSAVPKVKYLFSWQWLKGERVVILNPGVMNPKAHLCCLALLILQTQGY